MLSLLTYLILCTFSPYFYVNSSTYSISVSCVIVCGAFSFSNAGRVFAVKQVYFELIASMFYFYGDFSIVIILLLLLLLLRCVICIFLESSYCIN